MIFTYQGKTEMSGQASELITDFVFITKALRQSLGAALGEEAADVLLENAVRRSREEGNG